MMNHDKLASFSLNQLVQIIDLLNDPSNEFNMISLSKTIGISLHLTRTIIAEIADSQQIFRIYIGEELYHDIKNKQYTFFTGHYDSHPLSIISDTMIVKEKELGQFRKIFRTFKNITTKKNITLPNYLIKEDYQNITEYSPTVSDTLDRMQKYFFSQSPFLCHTKDGGSFYPIALYHDAITSKIFCVTLSGEMITFCPIDKIHKLDISKNISHTYSDLEISTTLKLLKYIWSAHPVSLSSKPELFCILLKNEPNTIEKIRHDVSNFDAQFITQPTGCLLLEIKIIYTDSFFSWLLSYGSSITVLEPSSARERIIETYQNIIKKLT